MWRGPREFLSYTTKQRNGILVLLLVILTFWAGLLVVDFGGQSEKSDFTDFEERIREWELEKQKQMLSNSHSLFYFDPNTASDSVFVALGLESKQIKTIKNYLHKGGKFKEAKDLRKIYDIDSSWFRNVESYIQIKHSEHHRAKTFDKKLQTFEINNNSFDELVSSGLKPWEAKRIINYRVKVKSFITRSELFQLYGFDSARVEELMPFVRIDSAVLDEIEVESKPVLVEINSADSLDLLAIKGVGPTFASRIIRYRLRLGGFVSKDQLLEVYGLKEDMLKSIKTQIQVDPGQIQRLSINGADFKTLLKHPYLNYEEVKSIIEFREKIRPFKTIEELKGIEGVSQDLYDRISPYLKLN